MELRNFQAALHNLATVTIRIRVRVRFGVSVRFRSGICKLHMRDFDIAQWNLQIAEFHKSHKTVT